MDEYELQYLKYMNPVLYITSAIKKRKQAEQNHKTHSHLMSSPMYIR